MLDKMNKKLIRLGFIFLILFLLGCTEKTTNQCTNEGLVISDYNIDSSGRIYPGYTVGVNFWLENRGSANAENIRVIFFDRQGFELESIDCGRGNPEIRSDGKLIGCTIGKIEAKEGCYGAIQGIHAVLRAPEDSGERTVSFSVNYRYRGSSQLLFSIWEKGTEKRQWGKKQKASSYGPVKVDIDTDFILERFVDGQREVVTEWVEEGQRFTARLDVKEVGSGNKYQTFDNTISPEYFEFGLDYVQIYERGKCDFPNGRPEEEIEYPTERPLMCELKVFDNIDQDWVTGSIYVVYSYNYGIVEHLDFTIE
jgi:hypothetical protein